MDDAVKGNFLAAWIRAADMMPMVTIERNLRIKVILFVFDLRNWSGWPLVEVTSGFGVAAARSVCFFDTAPLHRIVKT